MDGDPDLSRMVPLVVYLPQDSATMLSVSSANYVSLTELLLREIEFNVRAFQWSLSEDAAKKRNYPDRIELPGETSLAEAKQRDEQFKAIEVADILGLEV